MTLRLLFVTHYFPPELGATQTRLGEVTAALVRRGHTVRVIAPFPHYPDGVVPARYHGRLRVRERFHDVEVVRTWALAVPNSAVLRRTLDYASFAATAVAATRAAGPADLVIGETPPLPAALAGWAVSRLLRRPFVCNVADLWVSSAVALGAVRRPGSIRAAYALERLVYRGAARVTTVTDGNRAALEREGVPASKLRVIPNGVDTSRFHPAADGRDWRARLLADPASLLVVYAGNHGLAQGLSCVVDAAELLRDEPDIQFALFGGGAQKSVLSERAQRAGLTNIAFLDGRPLEEMPGALAAADVCLATLRKGEIFRSAIPSKVFEAMAAARPVVVAAEGEAAALVERAQAGLAVAPEKPAELAAALCRLRDDNDLRRRLGENGRRFVVAERERERLVDEYERLFEEVVARAKR